MILFWLCWVKYTIKISVTGFSVCKGYLRCIWAVPEMQATSGPWAAHQQSLLRIVSQGLLTRTTLSTLQGPNQLLYTIYLYLHNERNSPFFDPAELSYPHLRHLSVLSLNYLTKPTWVVFKKHLIWGEETHNNHILPSI